MKLVTSGSGDDSAHTGAAASLKAKHMTAGEGEFLGLSHAEALIRNADLALYRAKDAGRGVYHAYEPELHVQAEERRVLEMALRQALEKNEMHLHYQPVVDAGTEEAGADSGNAAWGSKEGAVWQLDPVTGQATRIAEINRNGGLPAGVTDTNTSIGGWETSGIIDVSDLYGHVAGTDFFVSVQAHGTTGGTITSQNLVEGGSIEHLIRGL